MRERDRGGVGSAGLLDYCCAERLHPQLLALAGALAGHGEIQLTREARAELGGISRATLTRRLRE